MRASWSFVVLAVISGLASPAFAQEPPLSPDEGGSDGTRRPGLIIAGVSALGSSYLATTALATANLSAGYRNVEGAFIPLAGPFVTAATIEVDSGIDMTPVLRAVYVAAGIGQLAGFGLTIAGLALPTERKAASPHLTITPIAGAGSGGLVAHGAF